MNRPPSRPLAALRLSAVVLASAAGIIAAASNASAAPSRGGCPKAHHWNLTDAATWRSLSVDGIVTEFGSLDKGAAALGFSSADELIDAIDGTFRYVDGVAPGPADGWICVSSVHPSGLPAFLFSVHNNKFHV